MNTSLTILAAAAVAGAGLPSRAVVQRAVEKLDLSSFPNSLHNRTEPAKKTLRQLGAQSFKWEDGALEVTEVGGEFVRTFRPLRSVSGHVRLCMDDQATHGTYLSSTAIELAPAAGGLYRARTVKDASCESYAR